MSLKARQSSSSLAGIKGLDPTSDTFKFQGIESLCKESCVVFLPLHSGVLTSHVCIYTFQDQNISEAVSQWLKSQTNEQSLPGFPVGSHSSASGAIGIQHQWGSAGQTPLLFEDSPSANTLGAEKLFSVTTNE